jgi:hypothetical protein
VCAQQRRAAARVKLIGSELAQGSAARYVPTSFSLTLISPRLACPPTRPPCTATMHLRPPRSVCPLRTLLGNKPRAAGAGRRHHPARRAPPAPTAARCGSSSTALSCPRSSCWAPGRPPSPLAQAAGIRCSHSALAQPLGTPGDTACLLCAPPQPQCGEFGSFGRRRRHCLRRACARLWPPHP